MLGDEVLCKSWPGGEVTLFISWMNVEGTGLKHAAWSKWANYFLVLFIWTIALAAFYGLLVGVSGMSHIPSDMLRLHARTMFYFYPRLEEIFLFKMD